MAVAAAVLVVAVVAWRLNAHSRRLRARHGALVHIRRAHDERAARAALRPRTGEVAAAPIHPPINGNRP